MIYSRPSAYGPTDFFVLKNRKKMKDRGDQQEQRLEILHNDREKRASTHAPKFQIYSFRGFKNSLTSPHFQTTTSLSLHVSA